MKNIVYKLRPALFTELWTGISIVLIIMVSACVPPSTSTEIKKNNHQFSEATKDNNEITELSSTEVSVNQNNHLQPDNTIINAEITGSISNNEPDHNNDLSVVTNQTKRVMRQRGDNAVKEQNIFYDRSNDTYNVLQKANESLTKFPVNRVGEVDWVSALNQNLINPRSSLSGNEKRPIRSNDIIMKDTKEMPQVRFPHKIHTYWLDCSNCHDEIFIPEVNANPVNMDKIFRGEYCGVCHNKVAFTTYMCEMCHSEN